MTLYTVEVTTSPVVDDNWSVLASVLDTVPGTVLIRDAEEPTLLIPTEASSAMRAAMFADGVSRIVGFKIESGDVYPTPDAEEYEDDGAPQTPVVQAVSEWMDSVPPLHSRLTPDGDLECV